MLTLGVVTESIRRFVAKLSATSSLSDEKSGVIGVLLANMTRAVELDAECEAHNSASIGEIEKEGWTEFEDEVTSYTHTHKERERESTYNI